jgi:hypothetical protein
MSKGKENVYIEDYLDEDPVITNQNFFILSYILPDKNNEIDIPFFKVRGSYKTEEECENRIKRLKMKDNYFNLFICEVGKWGVLYTTDQLYDLDHVKNIYTDKHLNELMRSKKANKDDANKEFEERKRVMTERNKFEGTAEGQKYLSTLKESPIAVNSRIEFAKSELINLQNKIKEMEKIKIDSEKTMETYSDEELKVLGSSSIENPMVVDADGGLNSSPVTAVIEELSEEVPVKEEEVPVKEEEVPVKEEEVPVTEERLFTKKEIVKELQNQSPDKFNETFNRLFEANNEASSQEGFGLSNTEEFSGSQGYSNVVDYDDDKLYKL